MKTIRKRLSADFKVKVALEAIRSDLALAELGVNLRIPVPIWASDGARHGSFRPRRTIRRCTPRTPSSDNCPPTCPK